MAPLTPNRQIHLAIAEIFNLVLGASDKIGIMKGVHHLHLRLCMVLGLPLGVFYTDPLASQFFALILFELGFVIVSGNLSNLSLPVLRIKCFRYRARASG